MTEVDSPTRPESACWCGAPTGDGAGLCRSHTDDLHRDLTDVADWLAAELDVTTTRQSRTTAGRHGGRSAERPLPWNEHASARRSDLSTTINAWALDVSRLGEDERDPLADHPWTDVPAVARWLARNLPTLRQHPEAGQAYDELTHAVREAKRAVDRPLDQEVYGKCLAELDDDTICQEHLYAPPGRAIVICRGCRSEHDAAKRKAWMFLHVRDMIGTIRDVVACLTLGGIKTSEDKVRLMASRGRFPAVQHDGRGRPMYRVSDVLAAIEDRYKRRKSAAA